MMNPPLSLRCPRWFRLAVVCAAAGGTALSAPAAPALKVLFLGDNGPHQPGTRLRELAPAMIARGIHLVYTEDIGALAPDTLRRYDALLIYANIPQLGPEPERALFDYVTQGGGLFSLHAGAASFASSDRFAALVGARLGTTETGTVLTRIAAPQHPAMQGFAGFTGPDETAGHTRHNEQSRTVLEYRDNEPWTWVRSEGRGRVFYTAWGHDARTWTNPLFHDLVERGLRFAAGQKLPDSIAKGPAVTPFEYVEVRKVPFYSNEPGAQPQGANPWPKMQKPLTAVQSMEHLVVPGGFELQLFAADPDIRKPMAMSWDERGRLWIIESVDYPNRLVTPGEPGADRIVICEDTNRDGRADRFIVFADGLNIPTSLTFAHGGVIVQQMPHTLFLKDTDGDDKADLREVLISGWGRRDTHAGPSNLVYGPDNWIWGMVGYSGFNGTVGGRALSFSQGFYRFKPDGSAFEYLRATNNNTWGIGVNEAGILFGSTANNNPSVYMPIPARFYEPAGLTATTLGAIADTSRYLPITPRVREVDVFWGYTAAAGHAVYTARSYPQDYWNRVAFVAEPTGHLVGQFNLEAKGADFRSRNPTNLIAGDDEWFSPIMAEVGPDGAVWISDWYNYIIQHNPTPRDFQNGPGNAYESELRDKRYGRIYRVVWKEGKPSQQPDLARATPAQLVAALKNDNLFWRRHAQRLLVERGRKDVVPALLDLVRDQGVDEIGLNAGATHALWTLAGLQAIDSNPLGTAAAIEALRHPSAAVRRNAATVLPRSPAAATALANAGLLKDSDGQVRLAALLALAESPDVPAAAQALHEMLATPRLTLDRWSADAAKMAASSQSRSFLAAASPEQMATAHATRQQGARLLLTSNTLMISGGGVPPGWELTKTAGEAVVTRANIAKTGQHSLQVALRGEGAAAGVGLKTKVKRHFRYELTGWIKSDGLPTGGGGRGGPGGGGGGQGGPGAASGASLVIPQLQIRGASNPVRGTSDWTLFKAPFSTGEMEDITIVCSVSLGVGDTAAGTAWFDEVVLNEIGPADESVSDPLNAVLNHLATRSASAGRTTAVVPPPGPAAVVLPLGVIPDVMKYDRAELTIKAGQPARIVFKNTDHMQHNVLVLRPGTIDAIGKLADQMLTDPQALAKAYVPASADVLFHTPLVNPGETFELAFTAPSAPGRYPFVCTFPGHWRIMQGVLVVTP